MKNKVYNKIYAKPVSSFLTKENSHLSDLIRKSQSITQINTKLKKLIDPPLCDNFELANINKEVATITVHNSTWATNCRYSIPDILKILNEKLKFKNIKTIKIKVKI